MDNINQMQEEKGEDLYHYVLYRFAPYWPLFVVLVIVSSLVGWLYLRTAVQKYEAKATILLKDERKGVDNAEVLEALDVYSTKKIVENEIEVIKSRTLMTNVVERLHLYAPIYKEGNFRDEIYYGYSPVKIEALHPKKLAFTDKVYFNFDRNKGVVRIENAEYPLNEWHSTPYGVLKFAADSNINYDPDGQLYFKLFRSVHMAGMLVGNLSLTPSNKLSTVLYLSLRDESPQRSQDILNELIHDYGEATVAEKNALASNTLAFIEDRLGYLVKEIDSIEHTIQNYKSKQGIVDLSDQGRLFLNNVGDNDRKLGSINMQLAVLDQVEKYVVSKDKKGGLVPSTLGMNDENLSKLVQRLYDAELTYERLRQVMGENSPNVVAVANEIETIRPAILESVRNHKQSLLASRQGISETNGQYSSIIRGIPQKERKLVEISREQTIKNGVYHYLLQKREETALLSSSRVPDSRIVDAAIASWNPVSPESSYVYLGAVVVALLLSTLVVIALEFLPGKILFRSDIEKYTKVPIVGEIGSMKKRSELVINAGKKAFVAEQFRQVRAGLGLYGRHVGKQSILITSSIAGEGKSFIAANLALSLSLSGRKVVLVDADFRSPKTSAIFNMENETGFVDYLKDEVEIEEIIRPTSHNHLFLIPAGSPTHNPTELLLNGKLSELFDHLSAEFDFVLVDTSPVMPVTDAYVLSDYCDKTLYVVRHGYTPKTVIRILDENRKIKALRNLFIVFNGVKKRGFIPGGYGYGYGFGYEYVYRDRTESKRSKT